MRVIADAVRLGAVVPLAMAAACSFRAGFDAEARCDRNGCSAKVSAFARVFTGDEAAALQPARDEVVLPAQLAESKDVKEGTILVTEDFLRRVTAVRREGDTVHADTTDASLADIVEQGETHATVDLAEDDDARASFTSLNPKAIWTGSAFSLPIDQQTLWQDPKTGARVWLDGTLSLRPSVDVGVTISGWSLKEAHLLANGRLNASIKVTGQIAKTAEIAREVPVWKSQKLTVRLPPIGGVPVKFQAQLVVTARIKFNADAQVMVQTAVNLDATETFGLRYADGGVTVVNDVVPKPTVLPPRITVANAALTVEGSLVAALDGGFYGGWWPLTAGGGARISVEPYARAEFLASGSAGVAKATLGVRAKADAYLKVLWQEFPLASKELFDKPVKTWPDDGKPADYTIEGACTSAWGIACGSGCVALCGKGQPCSANADCSSSFTCVAGSCESGGGTSTAGTACVRDADCDAAAVCLRESHVGAAETRVCRPVSCFNATTDDGEADVDCGGPCATCPNYALCASDADCTSGFCAMNTKGGICRVRT